jgi:hypothetical protein
MYTTSVVASPPANAATATVRFPNTDTPSTITVHAPTAAPDDTPITCCSASGLPNTPCSSAPATPRHAPTNSASVTRGNRTAHNAFSPCGWVGSGPRSRPR